MTEPNPEPMRDMGAATRVVIEVVGGMVPGRIDPKFGRRWVITADEWKPRDLQVILDRWAAANAYALRLAIDSASGYAPNWVRVDWIWL